MDLAARQGMKALQDDGEKIPGPEEFANPDSEWYHRMVDRIRRRLRLTTLKYQRLDDLVGAIGLPKKKLCTYCWDGCEGCK
jgi:amidophosphoribosyltransferase